ncbi:MAG: dihydrofolate reductase [Chitinophagales bacterium]|nr:dihydrofolate reductase [Chitinophagales bacterium]
MNYKIIVAFGLNNEIGAQGNLLWHLPTDMRWFKENTTGADVLMGRKTYDSFPDKYKPLPNRTNIVITRNKDLDFPKEVLVCNSLKQAFEVAEKCTETEKYIIGGADIYKQALPFCNELLLTKVHATFPQADAFFPEIDYSQWQLIWEEHHAKDEKHAFDFTFCRYVRK